MVIQKDVQGWQQKFMLNVETVHVKRLQACFKQLEYRKENKISTDTFTLRTPTAILTASHFTTVVHEAGPVEAAK